MNCNNYNVTMPYSDLVKWQKIEQELTELKQSLQDCYTELDNDIIQVDITKLKEVSKKLLANRYQERSYVEVR